MRPSGKTCNKSVTTALAEAIASFDIREVENLLADGGEFAMQNTAYITTISGKKEFVSWLGICRKKLPFMRRLRKKMSFNIVQSLHHVAGNPIIIFEDGRFPVFSASQKKNEHSGLIVRSENNKITGIDLCLLILKTEAPFIYEKRNLNPEF